MKDRVRDLSDPAILVLRRDEPNSLNEAAGLVQPGDWIDYAITFNQPDVFDEALAARKAELRNVKIRSAKS